MFKVYIVGGDDMIASMFEGRGYSIVQQLEDSDIVCFTGGHDVYPPLYDATIHPTTRYSVPRDTREQAVYAEAKGKIKVGICRGSQFLNVMNGGKLFQDVDRHAIGRTHKMHYLSDSKYDFNLNYEDNYVAIARDRGNVHEVTSTHHQMMRPNKETGELWGVAFLSTYRDRDADDHRRRSLWEEQPDAEIVYYPDTTSLCFQAHPEYGVKSCEDLFFTCLDRVVATL